MSEKYPCMFVTPCFKVG